MTRRLVSLRSESHRELGAEAAELFASDESVERGQVEKTLLAAARVLGFPLRVEWNARYTAKLGLARTPLEGGRVAASATQPFKIVLSSTLWPRMQPEVRRTTAIHELAHCWANWMAGKQAGHGTFWVATMRALGIEDPQRLATDEGIDTTGLERRRRSDTVMVTCGGGCVTAPITKARWTKFQTYKAVCRRCHLPFKLVESESPGLRGLYYDEVE